jgi:hypothetical protein
MVGLEVYVLNSVFFFLHKNTDKKINEWTKTNKNKISLVFLGCNSGPHTCYASLLPFMPGCQPFLVCFVFQIGSLSFALASLRSQSPNLCLLSSWYYRCVPSHLTPKQLLNHREKDETMRRTAKYTVLPSVHS